MRFPRLLVALLLVLFWTSFSVVDVDAAKGSGRSAKSGTTSKPKTVHVKEYTRKDGTKVKAHDRSAPNTKAAKPAKATAKPPKTPAVAAARDEDGRIKRSEVARHTFEVQTGYPHGRPGYVIDHIKPLACGGVDDPSNMQWQTIAAAKAKDRLERIGC